ncbi:MAG: single-stranded-DNA-specific exonuclease RecJ [Lachnospiraceae bacterium]|nr:single-stranded-DNA-specific exonuclease RecJ [Lachnospiraceae bacterium]
MKKEKWILTTKRADFEELGKKNGISPVLARLLVNRGVDSDEKIMRYLSGGLDLLYSPWLLKDMEQAVSMLIKAREEQTTVAISSDFDCDGIFSGFLLKQAFERISLTCKIFTPKRVEEGYGLNYRIINEAKEMGAGLIITCDNGIAAVEEIEYAKSQGLSVIVTDHHEVQDKLPPADAIVNPKQADDNYPFPGLCGAGVAYKLVCALYERCQIPKAETEEFLQYVSIATVADVMDLADENRVIVKEGLKRLNQTDNIGIRKLIHWQGLAGKRLSAYHIGFVLGPCFNASGRLQTVDLALSLLNERDEAKADLLAKELKELNDVRKEMTLDETERAIAMLEDGIPEQGLDKVIIIYLPDCHESLAGIIAGRIREHFHHPAIVFTGGSDGVMKGSGRSIEGYHMFEALFACKELFLRFGGHKMAAGMSIRNENFEKLRQQLNENCGLTEEDFIPTVQIDIALPVNYISDNFLTELEKMEPMGKGNPRPVFAEQHFRILRAVKRGQKKNVLAMNVENERGAKIEALIFEEIEAFETFIIEEFGRTELEKMYRGEENKIDVAFTYFPSVNEYNGFRSFQIKVGGYCRIQR